jgi:hypothetical protein
MPLVDNKLPMCFGKLLRPCQLTHFQAERFPQFDSVFDFEDRFATAIANMNMNWPMLVAVEEESIAVLFEDPGHA